MDWLFYLVIAIIFMSLNQLIVKSVLNKASPYAVLFYQYLVALPLVGLYALVSKAVWLGDFTVMTLLGFVYFIALGLYYTSMSKGDLSKVSPLFNLKMLVTAFLGIIILSEPVTVNLILGLFFGTISVYLLGGS